LQQISSHRYLFSPEILGRRGIASGNGFSALRDEILMPARYHKNRHLSI
jgi:hypothetical protein